MAQKMVKSAVLVFPLAAVLQIAAATTLSATVDTMGSTVPFRHNWKKCVGSGHMLLGTRSDWRAHLKLAHDELGFTGIRGHGLFDDDMSVVPNKNQPPEFYNVDQVMDYLVSLKMKPIVELSFMPSAFVACGKSGQKPCAYSFGDPGSYKGLNMPPDDFEDWYKLVKDLAEHLVTRYGIEEISSWHFEVWNEMWGVAFPQPYMKLYNASALALKAVNDALKVGGPATMQTQYVKEFIEAAEADKLPVDFVSTHYYPTDPQCQTNTTKGKIDCFADEVLAAQAAAAKADKPFFITEYNNGLGKTSRDDASAAAFVFRVMGMVQKLDLFSWWTFSDVFEEGWMRSAPFHNGYGLMTMQGTRKPAWRAFEMLKGAGTERFAVTGDVNPASESSTVSVLATNGGGGPMNAQMFVANWHRVDAQRYSCDSSKQSCVTDANGAFTDEALCNANCGSMNGTLTTPAGVEVVLTVKHAATASAGTVTIYRIDEDHANPQALWQQWGSPQYVTPAQITALDEASMTKSEVVQLDSISATESKITLTLPEMAAVHIIL